MDFFRVQSVKRMRELIDQQVRRTEKTEEVRLSEALGRVLAEDIKVTEDVPSFTRSTVDGYAVISKDTYGASEAMPGFLQVIGEVEMGEVATKVIHSGQAVYVPTGGMLPEGSDAVVMIEDCEQVQDLLNVTRAVAKHENVIRRGEDASSGDVLLYKGKTLRPQELGALASLGIDSISVVRKVVIGYLSSGDEIVPYDTKELALGKIRDVNGVTIPALAKQWGVDVKVSHIASDQFNDFYQKAERLFQECDALFISGGSSVGAKDYTTEVIESLGDNDPGIVVHGVAVKPGKPTIFSVSSRKPVIGLPGHPASAMIIFQLFGKQIISRLGGEEKYKPVTTKAVLSQNIPSSPGRTDYIRVTLEEGTPFLKATPALGKSGLMKTLVKSDGLLEIEEKKEGIKQGDIVTIHYFL
ncbi:molybdopterin molybdenumtransferase MoeA [Salipaludibacillus keqinensis]|uniref:Molybdopterin molybdenumtransferase n=1 Tax=Salipaludibacillus keqinensis TaxID=2045207 RepID=A0A323TIQ8_9BACI|nr:gephyrin-like molybdotransferase Glp [Salipaludibacillus keqinensis]PYZ93834.1 molybdopterin molybdenumtransferase MoeA [Salipaludibacillus keqinensis]